MSVTVDTIGLQATVRLLSHNSLITVISHIQMHRNINTQTPGLLLRTLRLTLPKSVLLPHDHMLPV